MHAQCRADIKWWNFWMYPGCVAVANFYWLFVSSPAGVWAFYDANSERCTCPCKNPSVEVFCRKPGTEHEVECRNVRKSDPNNCGGCDFKCPYRTHCTRDSCQCDEDRCGNVCMDLKSHPNNCGRCGNSCASGFCWKGVCYDPPAEPEFCIPGQALINGNFPNGNGTGWNNIGSNGYTRLRFGNEGTAIMDMLPGGESWFGGNSYMATGFLRTTARVCPGTAYDATFRVKHTWSGESAFCSILGSVGGRTSQWLVFLLAEPNAWADFGPFRIEPFQEGQGTAVNKFYVGVDVVFEIGCMGIRSPGQVILADISMHPS